MLLNPRCRSPFGARSRGRSSARLPWVVREQGGVKGGNAKIAPPSVLDGKRANNMAIALAQFKNFYKPLAGTSIEGAPVRVGTDGEAHDAWKDLCVAVLRQDTSDLNPDKVPHTRARAHT